MENFEPNYGNEGTIINCLNKKFPPDILTTIPTVITTIPTIIKTTSFTIIPTVIETSSITKQPTTKETTSHTISSSITSIPKIIKTTSFNIIPTVKETRSTTNQSTTKETTSFHTITPVITTTPKIIKTSSFNIIPTVIETSSTSEEVTTNLTSIETTSNTTSPTTIETSSNTEQTATTPTVTKTSSFTENPTTIPIIIPDNCQIFDENKRICSKCINGYYLPDEDESKLNCIKCSINNCLECKGTKIANYCYKCQNDYSPIYEESNNTIIKICNLIDPLLIEQQCLTFKEDGISCSSCNPFYSLKNGKCEPDYNIRAVYKPDDEKKDIKLTDVPSSLKAKILQNGKIEEINIDYIIFSKLLKKLLFTII